MIEIDWKKAIEDQQFKTQDIIQTNKTTTNETQHVNSTLAPVIAFENKTVSNETKEVPDISPFNNSNSTVKKEDVCSCPVVPACASVSNITLSSNLT